MLELQRSPIKETRVRNYSGSRLNSLLGGHVKTRPSQKSDSERSEATNLCGDTCIGNSAGNGFSKVNNIIPAIFTTIVVLFTVNRCSDHQFPNFSISFWLPIDTSSQCSGLFVRRMV